MQVWACPVASPMIPVFTFAFPGCHGVGRSSTSFHLNVLSHRALETMAQQDGGQKPP